MPLGSVADAAVGVAGDGVGLMARLIKSILEKMDDGGARMASAMIENGFAKTILGYFAGFEFVWITVNTIFDGDLAYGVSEFINWLLVSLFCLTLIQPDNYAKLVSTVKNASAMVTAQIANKTAIGPNGGAAGGDAAIDVILNTLGSSFRGFSVVYDQEKEAPKN